MTLITSLRVVEATARIYRHTWRGSVISTFAVPFFTLLAMGSGLGRLVDQGGNGAGAPYLAFLAPALLAATGMMTAAGESSYPVLAGIKWTKTYHAALATPVTVNDLMYGLVGWLGIRLLFSLLVYGGIMVLMGAMEVGPALAALGPAVLTGLAFATPVTAWVSTVDNDMALASFFRFGVMPLFLFSGTFFPTASLPAVIRPVVFLSPLWHGVELARGAAGVPGSPHLPWWGHTLVLIALFIIGLVLAVRNLNRTMRK
jgi:lipooligosaccharide transport system permease protein